MEQAIGSDSERQIISILKILSESSEPLGARTISRKLEHEGIFLGERGVRYHLSIADLRGYTRCLGRDGRMITQEGLQEVKEALAAQFGIMSAQLAGKETAGVVDPLTGERGYFTFYCKDYHPEVLTKGLGKQFHTEVVFKPYPCCRANHSGVDAALEIVRKHEINANDIDAVTIVVSPWALDFIISIPFEIEGPPHNAANLNAHQSLQYNVANVLLRKGSRLEHFTDDSVRDPKIAELIKKIKITSEGWPTVLGETFFQETTVKLRMKNGEEYSECVRVGKGHEIYAPMSREEKKEKFLENTKFSRKIALKNAEKALDMLDRLEEVDDIKEIVRLLAT
ncbi:winged-helix domain-containing protein [Chloroflexota bacterium]